MIYTKKLQWTDKLNQGTDQPTNRPQRDSYIPHSNYVWWGYKKSEIKQKKERH